MLIATFGPSAGLVGAQITYDDEQYVLEGHGPVSPGDIMEYDRLGHLVWATEDARTSVRALAGPPVLERAHAETGASAQVQELLDKARAQTGAGRYKAAVDTLLYVETQVRGGEHGAAGSLLELASELRDQTRGGVRHDCERFMESAQKVLDDRARLRERLGPHATGFAPALYLGIYPDLHKDADRRGAGVLWFAQEWVGIGTQEGDQRQGAFLPMSAVESVEVLGGRISKGAGELIMTYAVFGVPGLVIGGVEDYRSEVVAHTRAGKAVHFMVDQQEPERLREAVAPLLESVGVSFTDQLDGQSGLGAIPLAELAAHAAPGAGFGPAQTQPVQQGSDVDARRELIEALERLSALHRSGALSDEEFAAFKAKLMEGP